ncbi:molybdopterin cofactor-binding domain-containing protein, partial [Acinetobacter baumannii]
AWQPPPGAAADTAAIQAALERQAREADAAGAGFAFLDQGEVKQGLHQALSRVEAVYRAPYLAHVTMEPQNCTAQVRDGRVSLWAPTQV